ncbi:LysM peptidoglycan-binding domain-containing protein [Fusibacter sp. JL298sf-3]
MHSTYKKRKKKLVIVSQTRFIIASVLTLIVLSLIFSYITGNILTSASSFEAYKTITVMEGDTLWSIAKTHLEGDRDIRAYIYDIKTYNALSSADIYSGQQLQIPLNP